jgi:hypothetical protein
MTTEFTQENFAIDFNEQTKVVEIKYQGVNALAIATLDARVDALETTVNAALASSNGTMGTLQSSVNSLTTLVNAFGNDVSAETLARLAGDELNSTTLTAYNNARIADIQAETSARGAALLAEAAARGVAISSATGVIITDVANLATTVSGLATQMGAANASIISVQDALSTETSSRAAQYSTILANYNATNAAIVSESVARADAISSVASQIEALSGSVGTTVYYQNTEPSSGMVAGDVWYDTDDGNKPYRYTGTAWVDVTDIRITNNAAAIVNEAALRVAADDVNAGNITTVSGSLSTETSNRIAGDSTLDTRITTEKNTLQGLITDEANLRIGADGVNASNISTVSASVTTETNNRIAGDNTLQSNINTVAASVTTEANARIAADGTITAKYGVKVNANGHVAGFGLIATNNTYGNAGDSEFVVDATRFKVFNGSSPVAPFLVSGGVVYMRNIVVENAQISSLTMTKVTAGSILGAFEGTSAGVIRFGQSNFDVGAGYWLGYTGGAYKLSIGAGSGGKALVWDGSNLTLRGADLTLDGGAGFIRYVGTNVASTYIDWYGSGSVTDANAKFYIKKNGQAYFGGDIRSSFAPRAWARFYKTSTNLIYFTRQLGFASASRIDTGRYQFNFAVAQPNRFYCVFAMCANANNIDVGTIVGAYDVTTSGFKLSIQNGNGTYRDTNLGQIIVFGSDEVVTEPPPSYDYENDYNPPLWGGLIP